MIVEDYTQEENQAIARLVHSEILEHFDMIDDEVHHRLALHFHFDLKNANEELYDEMYDNVLTSRMRGYDYYGFIVYNIICNYKDSLKHLEGDFLKYQMQKEIEWQAAVEDFHQKMLLNPLGHPYFMEIPGQEEAF